MDNEFRMKRNCLNCKNCNEDLTCKKDGENIPLPFSQELKCCEMKETSLQNEKLMNILHTQKGEKHNDVRAKHNGYT